MTIYEFCVWAEITQSEAEEEIRSNRLQTEIYETQMVINLQEAIRWIKEKHGLTMPFNCKPIRKDVGQVNPFADNLLIDPLPLSTIILRRIRIALQVMRANMQLRVGIDEAF
jgi:hypothetical protein